MGDQLFNKAQVSMIETSHRVDTDLLVQNN